MKLAQPVNSCPHSGDFMGIPATGSQIVYNGMSGGRFEGGKVVEEWTVMDMFALMQQLRFELA